jgi:hypothetical protein
LVGKPEGERQLGRPGYRKENNIKMYLIETDLQGRGCVDWLHLPLDRDQWWDFVKTGNAGNCLSG